MLQSMPQQPPPPLHQPECNIEIITLEQIKFKQGGGINFNNRSRRLKSKNTRGYAK